MSGNRNGYTEIASHDSSLDGETKHWTNQIQSGHARRNLLIAGLIGVGILSGVLLSWTGGREKGTEITVSPNSRASGKDTVALFRPFCEYAALDQARVIQTSMKEPSNQWSKNTCYKREKGLFSKPDLSVNTYGAPDAIIKVNFSQLAFPDRDVPILGFGGAFTEASALNYKRLSEQGKIAVMELLFGKDGLGYSIGRVHINSCDFSVESYSFDDVDGDFNLTHFDTGVTHDTESGMIDMALRATSVFRQAWGEDNFTKFRLFASPWSPPAWMKRPTDSDPPGATHALKMTGSDEPTCLREGTGPSSKYAASWALYFSKFLTAYANLGLPFWAITVQNEPEFAAPWEACAYTPEVEADFIAYHLGPQLRKDHPDVKIIIHDHNKDHVNNWTNWMLNMTHHAKEYVDGTGYHWYAGGMDRMLDGAVGQANLHRLQTDLDRAGVKSSHLILGTESCHCPTTGYAGGDIEVTWSRAERYAHTILADLAAGSNGWLEWNLILDGIGGPNHLGNLCETGLLAVPHREKYATPDIGVLPDFELSKPFGDIIIGEGRTREELNALGFPAAYLDVGVVVQPIYFYMGHISRYVRPGSVAVMGLVTASTGPGKIFMPENAVVMGGGQNDLAARHGLEVTVWPCEGSTRQQFQWDIENERHIQVRGHDWLGNPTKSCIGRAVDESLNGFNLTDCKKDAGVFDMIPIPDDEHDRLNVIIRNHPDRKLNNECLAIVKLHNNGGAYGPRGGAQLGLSDCDDEAAKWKLNKETGEATSLYFADENGNNEVCLTTGWPFLQMGAFLTATGESTKTIVILNEARDSANYALQNDGATVLTGSIPPRSIQTLLLD